MSSVDVAFARRGATKSMLWQKNLTWRNDVGLELTPLDRTGGGLGREHDVFPG